MKVLIITGALFASLAVSAANAQQCPTCTDGACSNGGVACKVDADCVAAAIEAACPCDAAWKNHGKHQSCVVRLRNDYRRHKCLTAQTQKTIARCAARSTCGKANAVLCCTITGTGTCNDPMPGDSIVAGTCSNDSALTCDTSAECTVLSTARVRKDAEACTSRGGYVSGTGSVCEGCTAPVACCVPAAEAGQPSTCQILTAGNCAAANGTSTAGAAPSCASTVCP